MIAAGRSWLTSDSPTNHDDDRRLALELELAMAIEFTCAKCYPRTGPRSPSTRVETTGRCAYCDRPTSLRSFKVKP